MSDIDDHIDFIRNELFELDSKKQEIENVVKELNFQLRAIRSAQMAEEQRLNALLQVRDGYRPMKGLFFDTYGATLKGL